MADTLLQAVYERYEAGRVPNPSWPAAFSAVQPEGTALAFPNMVIEQPEPERCQLQQGDDETLLNVTNVYGPARLTAYAEGLAPVSALMVTVRAWMEAAELTIGNDTGVRLERFGYQESVTGRRGPRGQNVFMARLTYRAMWTPA